MSLKIYNGHKLPKMSIDELFNLCKKVQKQAESARLRHLKNHFKGKKEYNKRRFEIQNVIWEDKDKLHLFNCSFEATFFPVEDGILTIPFCLFTPISKSLTKHGTYFGYWDNVDKDTCSDKEWELRKTQWESVFRKEGSWVPSKNGFSFTFLDDLLPEWK